MSTLLLVVEIAGRRVALLSDDVRSVIELDAVTPIPRAPDHVAGLATLRSGLLTVIDCARVVGLSGHAARLPAHAAVVEIDGHTYALRVDRVEDVTPVEQPIMPARFDLGAGWARIALGMAETASGPMLVVNPAALVAGMAPLAA